MISVAELLPRLYLCNGLYELTLHFGGEHESLPQRCIPSQIVEPLEATDTPQS